MSKPRELMGSRAGRADDTTSSSIDSCLTLKPNTEQSFMFGATHPVPGNETSIPRVLVVHGPQEGATQSVN